MLDGHCHTNYSGDSSASIEGFKEVARKNKFSYLAFTDHFDPDFAFHKLPYSTDVLLDVHSYIASMREVQNSLKADGIDFACGVEIGYYEHADGDVKNLPDMDILLNSIHISRGLDPVRNPDYFACGVRKAMQRYILTVLESLDLDYDYSVITHFGYASRYIPEGEKIMRYRDYKEEIDEVLAGIIRRDKTLEYNTKMNNDIEIFKRYYELGGRKISFGSDAHEHHLLGNKYKEAVKALSSIGFDHWTGYRNLLPVKYDF